MAEILLQGGGGGDSKNSAAGGWGGGRGERLVGRNPAAWGGVGGGDSKNSAAGGWGGGGARGWLAEILLHGGGWGGADHCYEARWQKFCCMGRGAGGGGEQKFCCMGRGGVGEAAKILLQLTGEGGLCCRDGGKICLLTNQFSECVYAAQSL